MSLSVHERLVLINQYRIMERLEIIDKPLASLVVEALEKGFESSYGHYLFDLNRSFSAEQGSELLEILTMFRIIHDSIERLSPKQRVELNSHSELKFQGFDYNDSEEASFGSYASFVMERENRYQELKRSDLDFNSHFPMLPRYRRMVYHWKTDPHKGLLSYDSLQQLKDASDRGI